MSGETTNWKAFNTPRLYSMLADEDLTETAQQASSWRTMATAIDDHRATLSSAWAELEMAWPPEKNASAAVFKQQVETLKDHLFAAYDDANGTAQGLDGIATALSYAKTDLTELQAQYVAKHKDMTPRWWDHAEDDLDNQARQRMAQADSEVQEAAAKIKISAPYKLSADRSADPLTPDPPKPTGGHVSPQKGGATGGSGAGGSTSGGAGGGAGWGSGINVPVQHDPVPPLPGHSATTPVYTTDPVGSATPIDPSGGGSAGYPHDGSSSGGPGLAGISPSAGGPGGAGGMPTGGVGSPSLPGGGGGGYPGGLSGNPAGYPGGLPVGGMPMGSPLIGEEPLGAGGLGARGLGAGGMGGGRLGAGGMGGMGGMGAGGMGGARGLKGSGRAGALRGKTIGAPAEEEEGARRPSRPSWLSEDPASTRRPGAAGGGSMAGGGGRGGKRGRNGQDPEFDPDNPWQTAEGVDPVIAPSQYNPRHDPGPNVIGWRP